jgi:hypothetical protein
LKPGREWKRSAWRRNERKSQVCISVFRLSARRPEKNFGHFERSSLFSNLRRKSVLQTSKRELSTLLHSFWKTNFVWNNNFFFLTFEVAEANDDAVASGKNTCVIYSCTRCHCHLLLCLLSTVLSRMLFAKSISLYFMLAYLHINKLCIVILRGRLCYTQCQIRSLSLMLWVDLIS